MYTRMETLEILEMYSSASHAGSNSGSWERVLYIAAKTRRTPRAIVAKLVKEGVYKKTEYLDKLGRPPLTKQRMVLDIESILNCSLPNLEKAPKETLRTLRDVTYDLAVNYEQALSTLASKVEDEQIRQEMQK